MVGQNKPLNYFSVKCRSWIATISLETAELVNEKLELPARLLPNVIMGEK